MKTLPLGNTGVEVSALCLGAMFLGTKQDEATSFRLLDQYYEAGGRFIDTANIYARWIDGGVGGESETVLGRWMKARGNRNELFIASKVGFQYADVPRSLAPALIEQEIERSLTRMGIETVDLYYAHNDDRDVPLRDSLATFNKLVESGKVRFIGASNYRAWRLERAHAVSKAEGWAAYCCLQQRFSYARPRTGTDFGAQVVVNEDMLDYAASRKGEFTMLAYSALLGGAYTRADREIPAQYAGPDTETRLAALREVASQTGATPNQVVLAWMLHSDPPVLPLIAASTAEQMAENIGALDVSLSAEQVTYLTDAEA